MREEEGLRPKWSERQVSKSRVGGNWRTARDRTTHLPLLDVLPGLLIVELDFKQLGQLAQLNLLLTPPSTGRRAAWTVSIQHATQIAPQPDSAGVGHLEHALPAPPFAPGVVEEESELAPAKDKPEREEQREEEDDEQGRDERVQVELRVSRLGLAAAEGHVGKGGSLGGGSGEGAPVLTAKR